ncbi:MAG: glycerol-3-phosphate dehydrogenase/oxidase, partial [Bacteroidales bacterium]|nr:glycerol-3-phosphate dehydrogenase/oxidase [Bacteroidales bacterium]
LVREASVERGRLFKNAPHLVKNLSFIIPTFNLYDEILYTLGLKFYDLLAGTLSMGKSKWVSRSFVREKLSNLRSRKISAGVLYHDGQFDDSRLAISLLRTADNLGGIAINYMPIESLVKDSSSNISGVIARDKETGMEHSINAKVVVNASGVFSDSIMEMDKHDHQISIKPSQGIHLVVDSKFMPGEYGLMIPKTNDGRVLFAVPWHNKIVLGTTDTPVDGISLEPEALEEEIDFILNTAAIYLVKPPKREDVLSVFAGLRPLAAPKEGKSKTKEISRSHKIFLSESGLVNIIGGKWTTYRKMAEDLVNKVEKSFNFKQTKSGTPTLRIHDYKENVDFNDPFYIYGNEAQEFSGSDDKKLLSEKLNIFDSQVEYALKYEMARKVEDVLARRTRALFLDARESMKMAPEVAKQMAVYLDKSDDWVKEQVEDYNSLAEKYILK